MDFLEKDLEDIIFEASQTEEGKEKLLERGLPINGGMLRQVELGNYGRADLLSISTHRCKSGRLLNVEVIELKKDFVDVNTLIQACRYTTAVQRYIQTKFKDKFLSDCKVTLIGKDIQKNDEFPFLYNHISDLCSIYKYSYGIDGIRFTYLEPYFQRVKENFENVKCEFDKSFARKIIEL